MADSYGCFSHFQMGIGDSLRRLIKLVSKLILVLLLSMAFSSVTTGNVKATGAFPDVPAMINQDSQNHNRISGMSLADTKNEIRSDDSMLKSLNHQIKSYRKHPHNESVSDYDKDCSYEIRINYKRKLLKKHEQRIKNNRKIQTYLAVPAILGFAIVAIIAFMSIDD